MSTQQEDTVEPLPQGEMNQLEANVDEYVDDTSTEESTEEASTPEKIKIGRFEFNSEDEAQAYIEKMERDNLQIKAYNEGLTAATVKPTPAEEKPAEPEDPLADIKEEEFWEKPKEVLAKVYKKAREDAKKEAEQIANTATQNVTSQAQREKLWSDFYESNPDLRGKEKYVSMILQDNAETIGQMEVSQGFQALATKVREELNMSQKPQKEMSSKSKPSPTGTQKNVTPKEKEEETLDFSEQLRKIRKTRGL